MTVPLFPPKGSPAQQADYWLALSLSPAYAAEQERAFQAWLNASPEHQAAWQHTLSFWQRSGNLTPEQTVRIEALMEPKTESAVLQYGVRYVDKKPRTFNYFAVAASLLLAFTLFASQSPGLFADYRTAVGEQQSIALTDGSTVLLNTDTRLSLDYSADKRSLILHEGQAYFTVKPDRSRPFTVQTSVGRITALGTAFEVKHSDGNLSVTVFHHAVKLDLANGQTIDRLSEGEQVEYKDGRSQPITSANLNQAKAWRENRLVFKDRPLQEVVTELDRYRPGKIILTGQSLAHHRVTGVFDLRDTDAALQVIENTLNIKEFRLTGKLVVLRAG